MNTQNTQWELTCRQCSHTEPCGTVAMLAHLQRLGMLKRAREPAPEMLLELLTTSLHRLQCSVCQRVGLGLQEVDEEAWQTTRNCASCGRPISPERLDVIPDTTSCATCARSPAPTDDADYCPKCGAVMSMRIGRGGGLTRYRLSCPECR